MTGQEAGRQSAGKDWSYQIKPGDTLWEIVKEEFDLKKPGDTAMIHHMMDLIVTQNRGRLPYLTVDKIKAGHVLKLRHADSDPRGQAWTYKIKSGDTMTKIVSGQYHLDARQDAKEINRLIDLIVADNRAQHPALTRDRIDAGDVLTLRHYGPPGSH